MEYFVLLLLQTKKGAGSSLVSDIVDLLIKENNRFQLYPNASKYLLSKTDFRKFEISTVIVPELNI